MDRHCLPDIRIVLSGKKAVNNTGFTLMEILIAMFIFAIVMTTIFGTFNGVISRTEAIKNGMGGFEMARTCLNRISTDLNAIYIEQNGYKFYVETLKKFKEKKLTIIKLLVTKFTNSFLIKKKYVKTT